jgi:DNA-binding NarL/FixJ family response regulator
LALAAMFIIADDHPLFRGAVRSALLMARPDSEILEAGNFEEATRLAVENPDADLMLLDLNMPGSSGLSGLMSLRAAQPSVPVVVISATDDGVTVRRALELGASGYVSKSAGTEEIREAISTVLSGGIFTPLNIELSKETDPDVADLISRIQSLTPQQKRVLGMLSEGLLNKQIAYELSISEATIKAHVSAILQKLNVDSRTQAVIKLAKLKSGTSG